MPNLKEPTMIAEAAHGPLLARLKRLLEENRWQAEMIQQMRDEISVLKSLMEGNRGV